MTARPLAGDAVRLAASWPAGPEVAVGAVGVLGGLVGMTPDFAEITFRASTYRDDAVVTCSGGPATIATPPGELYPTGETATVRCWRFKNGIRRAHNDEEFTVEVPVWDWYPGGKPAAVAALLAEMDTLRQDRQDFTARVMAAVAELVRRRFPDAVEVEFGADPSLGTAYLGEPCGYVADLMQVRGGDDGKTHLWPDLDNPERPVVDGGDDELLALLAAAWEHAHEDYFENGELGQGGYIHRFD